MTDDEVTMSLLEHLEELRSRIIVIAIAILLAGIVGFYLADPLIGLLRRPLPDDGAQLIQLTVGEAFGVHIQVALMAGVALAMPVILYQVWAFVAPGLYRHERRFALPLFVSSVILFYAGAAFAYFVVFPLAFKFFVGTTPEGVRMMTDMTQYMDFAVLMFFAFGLAFEIPVATVLLVRTGLVKRRTLTSNRGYVILGIFIVAAFLTPPDPVSQTMMAIPMYLLYEGGVLMSCVLVRDKPEPEQAESA